MKFKSLIFAQASGSVGGLTFLHGRGGLIVRARSIPTDPGSPEQVTIRGFMAALTSGWNDILTPAQREGWDLYALQVPISDSLGEPRNVGGIGMYVRSNVPRLQVALPRVDDAPTIFNLGEFTDPVFDNFVAAADTFDVTFDNTDAWANEDDSAMLLFSSRPQNTTINFFKGPYRTVNPILGDLALPPTSPDTAAAAFGFDVGQRVFVYMRITRADGRLSARFRGNGVGA